MSTPAQIAALVEGNIYIGIVRLPIFHTELDSWPLFHERLVLATSRSLPYHRRHGLAALRDQPFVFFPRATSATLHDHVLGLCGRAGFTPMIVQEASELFTCSRSAIPRARLAGSEMADWDRVESFFRQGGVDFEVRGYDARGCTQREGFRDFQVGGVYCANSECKRPRLVPETCETVSLEQKGEALPTVCRMRSFPRVLAIQLFDPVGEVKPA